MAKKTKIKREPTPKEMRAMKLKSSTPLKKVDDALNVTDIIKDDAMLVKVHFVSGLMVRHKSNQEISDLFEAEFGEPMPLSKVGRFKNLVRAVYIAEISRNKDDMVAEELMHAEWELRELMDYWEKSKSPKKKTVKHDADSDGTELTTYELHETTETEEEQIGDLDAMKRIAVVRERVINLLGLNAPKQQAVEEGSKKSGNITINVVGATRTTTIEDVQPVE